MDKQIDRDINTSYPYKSICLYLHIYIYINHRHIFIEINDSYICISSVFSIPKSIHYFHWDIKEEKQPHNMLAPHQQDDMTRVLVGLKPNLHLPLASWMFYFCIQIITHDEAHSRLGNISERSNPIGAGIQSTVIGM